MHLLFLNSLLPEREATCGLQHANHAIAEEYRRQGVRITCVGFRRPQDVPAEASADPPVFLGPLAIENSAASPGRKLRWLVSAAAQGLPVAAAKLTVRTVPELRKALRSVGPVDGHVLSSIQLPAAYPFLVQEAPSIYIAHNVEHVSALQNADAARSAWMRVLYRRESRLLQRAEERLCRLADVVHTLTQEDLSGLGLADDPRASALALTLGRTPRTPDGHREHDVGLIGNWGWAPNRIGLEWFVREVAPRLPASMTVRIAGRFDGHPPPAPPQVRFVGRVPDAPAFLHASRVVALSARGGTGVQLKTVEAFEEGLPVVSTRSSVRGMTWLPGNARVRDDAAGYAEALVAAVDEDRSGRATRVDGRRFTAHQQRQLSAAIARGLSHFESALRRRRSRADHPAAAQAA